MGNGEMTDFVRCLCEGDVEAHRDTAEVVWPDGRRDLLPTVCEYFGGPEEHSTDEIAAAWYYNPEATLVSVIAMRLYRLSPDVFYLHVQDEDQSLPMTEREPPLRTNLRNALAHWLRSLPWLVESFTQWSSVVSKFVDGDLNDGQEHGIPIEQLDPDAYLIGLVGVTLSEEAAESLRSDPWWRAT